MESSKKSSSPAVDVLSLLQQYESLHESASTSLRASFWNITKARRERGAQAGGGGFGGLEYSVDDVREQLRASALLECNDEEDVPTLNNEDDSLPKNGKTSGKVTSDFVLHFDGMEHARQVARHNIAQAPVEGANDDEGLRRRGNAAISSSEEKTIANKWTSEDVLDEEEENLRKADPLCLFGVPPPALRVAQTKSRDAIAYYVEVANLAKEIVKITTTGDEVCKNTKEANED